MHFAFRFYIQKARHFALYFSIKECTLRYVFISKIYCIVLIPSYKLKYNQTDQIDK